jgi:hypothetical protein
MWYRRKYKLKISEDKLIYNQKIYWWIWENGACNLKRKNRKGILTFIMETPWKPAKLRTDAKIGG